MTHKKGGAVISNSFQSGEDSFFCFGIHCRKAIIEYENGRLSYEPPRKRGSLFLSAREGYTALAEYGVEPLRKAFDGVIESGSSSYIEDFRRVAARIIIGNVCLLYTSDAADE